MTIIGLTMNVLLAVLLLAALGMGMRLNGRLKALRDSHEGFATAVHELNAAAARAEQGLADLRAASDEALDILSDRISAGRNLAGKLETLIGQASQVRGPAARQPEEPELDRSAERRLGALLAAAREARPSREGLARASDFAPIEERPARRAAPAARPRFTSDDDIFDDEPLTLDTRRTAAR